MRETQAGDQTSEQNHGDAARQPSHADYERWRLPACVVAPAVTVWRRQAKAPGEEIEQPCAVVPQLIPGAEQRLQHRISKPDAAAEEGDHDQCCGYAPEIVGYRPHAKRGKSREENCRDDDIGHEFEQAAGEDHIERRYQRELQERGVAGHRMRHPAAGVDKDVIGDEAGIRAQMGPTYLAPSGYPGRNDRSSLFDPSDRPHRLATSGGIRGRLRLLHEQLGP